MQELRLVLIIVGALAITALLFHGLWTSRKEKPAKFGEKPVSKIDETALDVQGDVEESVSEARVISKPQEVVEKTKPTKRKEPGFSFGERPQQDPLLGNVSADDGDDDLPKMSATDNDDVLAKVTTVQPQATTVEQPQQVSPQTSAQPAQPVNVQQSAVQPNSAPVEPAIQPQVAATINSATVAPVVETQTLVTESIVEPEIIQQPQQPVYTPVQETVQQAVAAEPVVQQTQSAVVETPVIEPEIIEKPIEKSTVEPQAQFVPAEELAQVEVATPVVEEEVVQATEPSVQTKQEPSVTFMPEPEPEPEPEPLPPTYISLCVHARSGKILRGPSLFACLERHGLIFGENSVFHRHADLAGTEPVIFSVTNLLNPGSFPETNYQHFETPGIGFFLMLPCYGKAASNFNLMLQTAQQIADELNADVLDQDRVMITPNRITQYREKSVKYNNA
ncbi:cell division protein ZipA [Photobacterium angustum]|uniref:cell division protein ZipA n=1 Tax=Photobacterium angustum TaxID=661 RepID=UPI0005E56A87|nr:cell division protein ZipA [Photobacterium angustum]KJG07404.1 cell division protein ZipA [Photobacterium angustum]PSV96269.1 cell division protein ZipA [Photobacterium angustum]